MEACGAMWNIHAQWHFFGCEWMKRGEQHWTREIWCIAIDLDRRDIQLTLELSIGSLPGILQAFAGIFFLWFQHLRLLLLFFDLKHRDSELMQIYAHPKTPTPGASRLRTLYGITFVTISNSHTFDKQNINTQFEIAYKVTRKQIWLEQQQLWISFGNWIPRVLASK